jgi:hypothetical protein
MILLSLLSAFECHHHVVVYLLTIIIFNINGLTMDYKYVDSFGFIMPVTTRSKYRQLQGSCNEQSQVCLSCSPVPISESSAGPLTKYMSRSTVTSTGIISSLGLLPHDSLEHSLSLLIDRSSSSEMLQNFSEFQNSKLIATASVESISNCTTVVPTKNNSLDLEFATMESDCKDVGDSSPPPDPPDLHRMLELLSVSLSCHISSQTALLQDEMSQQNKQLAISQANFRNEVQNELDEFCQILSRQQSWIQSKFFDASSPLKTSSTLPAAPSPPVVNQVPSSSTTAMATGVDIQSQMLMILIPLANFPAH